MPVLTGGLATIPIGQKSATKSSPPRILTGGLGSWSVRTCRYTRFNTPVMGFYLPNLGTVVDESSLAPGVVQRESANGTDLNDDFEKLHREYSLQPGLQNTTPPATYSKAPYFAYGTQFVTPPNMRIMFDHRLHNNGDMEYATFTPHPTSYYNARSLMVYLPRSTVLSSTSISRFKYLLAQMKELAVNVRLRRDGGKILLESLGQYKTPNAVWRSWNGETLKVPLSGKFDIVSSQEYSGLGD